MKITFLNQLLNTIIMLALILLVNSLAISELNAEQSNDPLALVPDPPPLEVSSYYLLDFDSGQTIASHQADTLIPPASLTKIMTVYVTFKELVEGRLNLTDSVPISEKAWRTEGSRMFLEPNKPATVEELLKGIIIQSGNDASVAMAEHISGNEATFSQLMNQTAQSLQMTNTHFENSMGLPSENHYTTARDLGILTRALIREFPQYYGWHSEKEYTYNNITQRNRNKLLWRDSTVDGVKTGHTEEAGYSLVASAVRNGRRLISIVTGTKSMNARANANQALLNYGFRFFATKQIFSDMDTIAEPRIWMGELKTIPAGLSKTLYVTAPSRYADQLNSIIDVEQNISAPIEKGQTLGSVKVMLGDSVISEQPLIALESVPEGGLLRRLYDQTYRFIKETTGYPKD